ncbi:AKAP7 2'5' RNA ligase-like domain protein [Rhizoctonia solani AG-3 Rhs1AP]|uniref:AKAP7 2'5' RNA ligase-like domain protein n=1 Tax=Rhizoctonia solani AG-3 Rhs1AP TaxID=1086054 RepID=X8JF48_9AGAM|nr:AKAP7 2'5' RNA ligase-like domain protein [Rhizoctonia solani AG-3 Rhs1AP]
MDMAGVVARASNNIGRRGDQGGARRPWRGRGAQGRSSQVRERPTHFISVPLDHLHEFALEISRFTEGLQTASPPITGLDPSIVISPRRLHLTLGVMGLTAEGNQVTQPPTNPSQERGMNGVTHRQSITAAQALLDSLKPDIESALQGQPLQLCLNEFAVMRRSPTGEADVMYIGPTATGINSAEHTRSVGVLGKPTHCTRLQKLSRSIEMINRRFIEEGFITDRRPLKLHCTILNTSHRKTANNQRGQRVPFSMSQIEDSIAQNPHITGTLLSSENLLAVRELNICRMGSYDELGRYVRVGGIEW